MTGKYCQRLENQVSGVTLKVELARSIYFFSWLVKICKFRKGGGHFWQITKIGKI